MRVLVAEPVASEGVDLLRADHEVDERHGLSRDELCAIIPDYDALIVRSGVQVDADLIAAGKRLAVIGRAGVGVDNVDLEAATRAGIVVVNAPTGNTIAAAEHTLALLYGVARKIAAADASLRRGEWKRAQFTGLELRGRTLGIVGLGKIGQAIAVRARAMEMTVLGVDPFVTAEAAANHGVELVGFDEMLARSDVVTVHVPLTRGTRGLIGRDAIARLKPGSIVLNVARGGVLDEAAVAEALRSGHLGGAGIDVFEQEPPTDSPLLDAPNTLLTPHLGASTAEAQVLVSEEVAAQVLDVLAGRSARYAVNAPLLTPETARALAPYLPLAEILGRFFAQFSRGGVRTLTLEIAGELAEFDGTPLTAAVLRGLLETSITERVNLVNAGALAKARGITVVERKTPDAGAFAALITLSGETGGRTTVVAGTVAGGEPRITRLDDYRLDMAPADNMLITRHMDRPGTVGRVGADAGRGRHQHQCDAPRPDAAARGRVHDPGARRRRPGCRLRRDPDPGGGPRPVDDPARPGPLTAGSVADRVRRPLIPAGLDATLVLVRHGESTYIVEGRFQGQAETPLSPTGQLQASLVATRLAAPHVPPALPVPSGDPLELVHSPLDPDDPDRRGDRARDPGRGSDRHAPPDPGFLEIHQGEWQGLHRDEIGARYGAVLAGWRRAPLESWAPGGESLPEVAARVRPALAGMLARLGEGREPGTHDRPQVAGYRDAVPDQPWSIVVGHDGVFKVALLTLFDLPLDRFWMWSMDLCGITVIEFRAGRPVLRAHNLTAHLAALTDEKALADLEERSRSGAL